MTATADAAALRGRNLAVWGLLGTGLLAIVALATTGAPGSWQALGVPALEPRWIDLRTITEGARCQDLGFDPLEENPCDPSARVMNYPRIWLAVANAVGRSAFVLAALGTLAYVVSTTVAFSAWYPTAKRVAMYGVACLSPSALLMFERGNIELFAIAFSTAAACLMVRRGLVAFGLATCCVLLASMAKIYPLVLFAPLALYAIVRPRRGVRVAMCGIAGALMIGYLVVTREDISRISAGTPTDTRWSYGLKSLQAQVRTVGLDAYIRHGGGYLVVLILVVLLAVARTSSRRQHVAGSGLVESPGWALLACGLLLFCATLPLANYSYRLSTLAPLLAGASALAHGSNVQRRLTTVMTSVILLVSLLVNFSADVMAHGLVHLGILTMTGCAVIVVCATQLLLMPMASPAEMASQCQPQSPAE